LYLVLGMDTFEPCVNCPYLRTTPTVHFTTISRFLCNFFPLMTHDFFVHHDSPSNLAESRWLSPGTLIGGAKYTANPTWGVIFEYCFKDQSLNLEKFFFTETWKKRRSNFELWPFENDTTSWITCTTDNPTWGDIFRIFRKFFQSSKHKAWTFLFAETV